MSLTPHEFAAAQYAPRAQDYVTSAVHASGADLDQLDTLLHGHATARVLDLGCGGGHVSYRAAPHVAQVVACDVTPEMLDVVTATAAARGLSNITTQLGAAEELPFEDAEFDIVLCRFSAHHWQTWQDGLTEARRVLKPGGLAVFIDTVCPTSRVLDTHLQAIELLRDASHVRNYNIGEWTAALQRAGFTLTDTTVRKLPMDFVPWTARTKTPAAHIAAIRSLQQGAAPAVPRYFHIQEDGSFTIDSATFVTRAV